MKHALALFALCAVVSGCSEDPFFPYYPADAQTADVASDGVTLPDGTSGVDAGTDTTDDVTLTDASGTDTTCTPVCGARECGSDGCGGSCGICSGGQACVEGVCAGGATGSCEDIIACVNSNECSDAACLNACTATATATAQNQFTSLLGCIQANCADISDPESFASCQQTRCAGELGACLGVNPPPTTECGEVANCLFGCTEGPCADACLSDATPEAQSQATALLGCAIDACGDIADVDTFNACLREACSAETDACFGV